MNYREKFIVEPGKALELSHIDPDFHGHHEDHASALGELEAVRKDISALQNLLYAEAERSLLIILQALDAGGKDGTVNHVLSAMNPQGCNVTGFKQPTSEEIAHDFLWRIHKHTPGKGTVAIFNRSHYEDVLVVRVHNSVSKDVWSKRYDLINEFERLLVSSGTHVLKFFLYISKEEQLRRFKDRLDDKNKQWKISESDYKERTYWRDYTEAFEDALSRCSTPHAPWFVIPSNHKWFRNLAVSHIICGTMRRFGMEMPKPTVDLDDIRQKYHKAEEN